MKNGIKMTDRKQKVNQFNNYFATVAQNVTKEIGETNKYLKNPNEQYVP